MDKRAHLVIVGFDEIVANKYISCIERAVKESHVDSYSIIDLQSQKRVIDKKIQQMKLRPEKVYYIPDPKGKGVWSDPKDFEPIFEVLKKEKGKLKIYIATELKAHEGYLKYCVENEIDSLTEKPIFAPFVAGKFTPALIEQTMWDLVHKAEQSNAKHSVMTLGRYHKIYNDTVIDVLKEKLLAFKAPLTSFHFRTAGGVWNLHREYETREDHPYKYGYGMLMHGAYHYIDLTTQFLCLNKLLFPKDTLTLTLSSYAAYPVDQNDRISKKFSDLFDDNCPNWSSIGEDHFLYGETDITTTFCLQNKETGKTITLGTMSFEQTTPSIRSWKEIPDNIYNKNGRTSNVDLEAQLSTLYSIKVECYDVPIRGVKEVKRIDAFARVSSRANASLLLDEEYNFEETFSGLFHSDSNRKLMSLWLSGDENKSQLKHHVPVMRLVQALTESIKKPGYPITFNLI
ncbi:MAG: hypothetical protein AAB706_01095 [Patescibacteria group bacterium]